MATFHENLIQSFKNFRDKYLKANGVIFQFSYDSSTGKFGYKDANGNFVPFKKVQASKTVSPSTSSQTVTPDSGYDGIAQITVNAVNLQSKTTTMTPPSPSSWSATTTKLGTVTPDSGYTGLSQVDISIPMVPDNTTLTLQSSGSDYDTYKPSRAGYVYTSSYLRVPKSGGETTIWTNSSPTSNFGQKNVTISHGTSEYSRIIIKYYKHTNSSALFMETIGELAVDKHFGVTWADSNSTWRFRPAHVSAVSSNSITIHFAQCGYWANGGTGYANNQLIPYEVVGIK